MSKKNNKSARKKAEQFREKVKQQHPLTEDELQHVLEYATYCVLYLNDCALNACRNIKPLLDKMVYKTKAPKTIYGALIRRIDAYNYELNETLKNKDEDGCISEVNEIDGISTLAEIFGEFDNICDEKFDNYEKSVSDTFSKLGIDNVDFYTKIEVADELCKFATTQNKHVIDKLKYKLPEIERLHYWSFEEVSRVMTNLKDYTFEACSYKGMVDFNNNERVCIEFRRLAKTLFSPQNFEKAYNNAVEEIDNGINYLN